MKAEHQGKVKVKDKGRTEVGGKRLEGKVEEEGDGVRSRQ